MTGPGEGGDRTEISQNAKAEGNVWMAAPGYHIRRRSDGYVCPGVLHT
jgi:hypothetical protein